MMQTNESVVAFVSGGKALLGILHDSETRGDLGVVVVVGGPQYRVGSHRMFVAIARDLARHGHPALRFDFTGMGDSEGVFPGFEKLDADLRAAIEAWRTREPHLSRFVLLGLCDGATAAAYYAHQDPRVAGVVLLNPWVHTVVGEAQTFLWHYYPRRVLQADFWRGLLGGRVAIGASLRDFGAKLWRVARRRTGAAAPAISFVERLRRALESYRGRVLVVASAHDFTASEFVDLWNQDERWARVRSAAEFVALPNADHTLSAQPDLRDFCAAVRRWLEPLREAGGAR